jgi:formylglycine-generating enzyme required for sulfatase activity
MNGTILSIAVFIGLIEIAVGAPPTKPGERFRDCPQCPEMVVIPNGTFRMGSDQLDAMRGGEMRSRGPIREVTIPAPIAVGRYEISNAEFAEFVGATSRPAQACHATGTEQQRRLGLNWRDPGYDRLPAADEPVVCVYWFDAQAYVAWLSKRTGKSYRLLSEAEWEYAANGGATTTWPWGDDAQAICSHGNVLDQDGLRLLPPGASTTEAMAAPCRDGYPGVAPVGRFKANGFGLHDMVGNVWEWVQDCSLTRYPDAPADGTAVEVAGSCDKRAVRGGSWRTRLDRQQTSFRGRDPEATAYDIFGFRVARDLEQ